jgi:hypothetical protein
LERRQKLFEWRVKVLETAGFTRTASRTRSSSFLACSLR